MMLITWPITTLDVPPDTQHAGRVPRLIQSDQMRPCSVLKQTGFWPDSADFIGLVHHENWDDSGHDDDTDDNRAGRSLK